MISRIIALSLFAAAAWAADVKVTKPDRVGRVVENSHYIADSSHRTVRGVEEDSGAIRALTYKRFGVTLLRTQNRMHWAPNLQRAGAPGYKGLGTWNPVQTFRESLEGETYVTWREGHLADYPEVKMEAEYRFLPDVPYFLFWSRMTVEKPLSVTLLRNNEMTMDPFFTHLAWPTRGGRQELATFDDRKAILEKEPISADAPWTVFLNLDKGYGYGFVMLDSHSSRTQHAETKISDGEGNGKYWSRYLISGSPVELQPGDRFEERVAYVLFPCSKTEPLREFLTLERDIRRRFAKR